MLPTNFLSLFPLKWEEKGHMQSPWVNQPENVKIIILISVDETQKPYEKTAGLEIKICATN